MSLPAQRRMRLSGGTELAYVTAGDPSNPALLLLHGFPSSSRTFRDVVPGLARVAYVIAPDLPGHGQSDVPPTPSFAAISEAISELLAHLVIGRRFIYVHDWGTAVGLQIAMQAPELVSGLIIQNANAHRTGFGPLWDAALKFWSEPTKENEAAATPDLTFEFTREQYTGGLPEEVAATIKGEPWVEDWRVMNLPGRMETHRALIGDYKNHAARFDAIAGYLEKWQPPALMLWGRHEPYFDIAETLSWMQDLPRMEAHIFDGGHFLLETHAEPALSLMMDFIKRTQERLTQFPSLLAQTRLQRRFHPANREIKQGRRST
ncbi:alpha/beta hydrolase [Mesorhizobium sp.]|uniref:alpha/beta fold hydrolase n=1 Tax=Mesorhizobium sp. TaxID=1871066 RepID=UPI000FE8A4F4|nr:alpha/beta hydrolase [Mesorhizobium sp.]RWB32892.1 MAG: alpha/beta hydrolase [Mesorhizobium sp.]RWD36329.1 MAG: alpha/beta hydrolase [Mesorhizobium sp.]RWD45231.1 MAG: alpha/beta hydrolase [Mesorhizobium sp.]RWD79911.1 MAG: alpha/beta hydrolase [Mesorhizobium sp.]RWE67531.1 MAG: alpha/beta hydrolase [Mesorhizobium sp.]